MFKGLLSTEEVEKIQALGSERMMTKMAQHDGYSTDSEKSGLWNAVNVMGQKVFEKQASHKKIMLGLAHLRAVKEVK